jgi:membrane associated rhomboid family serine protease
VVIPVHDENYGYDATVRPWVMWLIFAVNIVIVIYLWLLPAEAQQWFVFSFGLVSGFVTKTAVAEGFSLLISPYLTLATYAFLHGSWVHLAGNMIFLWVFGDNIEAAMGHIRFLLFYLLCAAGGGIAHLASDPASAVPLIGASGAVSGIVAAYLMLHPWAHVTVLMFGLITLRVHAYWLIGAWIALQLLSAMLVTGSAISYWSHVGGLITGAMLVLVLRRRGVRLFQRHIAHWP